MSVPARALGILVAVLAATSLLSCSKSQGPSPVCTLTLAPASHAVPADGGTRTVTVTTSAPSCAWTAGLNVAWIGLPTGGSGTGSGDFTYVVSANPATEARTGVVTVGSQNHTVTQDGRTPEPPPPPPCTYQLTPESATVGSSGGTGTVQVETPTGCAWSATPNDGWITIESGAQGSGTGSFAYRASAHGETSQRTGTVTVADRTFTLRQDGLDLSSCSYAVSPVEFTPCLFEGSVTTRVDTADHCPWTVATAADWLTIDGAPARTGPGDLRAQFGANFAAPREAVLEVRWPTITAGQNVRVAQAGCIYATTVSTMAIGAAGGSLSFGVFQQAVPNVCGGPLQDRCVWTASTTAPWITITSTMPRQGDNPVAFTVAANTSTQARTGTIVVQDRVVTIEQAGVTP